MDERNFNPLRRIWPGPLHGRLASGDFTLAARRSWRLSAKAGDQAETGGVGDERAWYCAAIRKVHCRGVGKVRSPERQVFPYLVALHCTCPRVRGYGSNGAKSKIRGKTAGCAGGQARFLWRHGRRIRISFFLFSVEGSSHGHNLLVRKRCQPRMDPRRKPDGTYYVRITDPRLQDLLGDVVFVRAARRGSHRLLPVKSAQWLNQ